MVNGLIIVITATYGYRMRPVSGRIIIMAIGFIQIMDGHGYQAMTGAGLLFTMGAGLMIMRMDGCGYQAINGRRHGFHGEAAEITMDGRP